MVNRPCARFLSLQGGGWVSVSPGLVYSEEEWEREWKNVITISSSDPRHNGDDAQCR